MAAHRRDRLGPTAYFTREGLKELREFASAPKFVDPARFRRVRVELEIDQDADIESPDD